MKIIVVDDEPLVKQYIVQCVRDAGGENEITAAVTSGAKVLQEMKTNPADVVFADITMPKMDGIELLQELRRQYPGTAVVMLTCHDDFEYARAAMQNGAKDYILKTEVSADKIRAVLDKLQSSRQQHISESAVQQIGRSRFLRNMVEQSEDMTPVSAVDLQENSIYLNRETLGEDGLVTLAHEGFPGHLYQTNYLRQKGESYVTQVLMPSGYTEGWGLYVEQYSLKYLTGDTNAAAMYKASRELSMILSCKADYGVNYEGWDKEKLEEELAAYGLDDEAVEELYQLLIASPGEYFKYYYTAHTIQTLYDKAKDELGILFKDKEFHKAILDAMPTEKGLNEAVEQYITQSRGQKKAETQLQPAA